MKKLQLALLLIVSVLVLIIIAIFSAPTFINWKENKGLIENIISDYTGYKTKIQGDLQVQILPNPKIYAEGLSLESMSGDQNLAKVGHIIITKELSDLLSFDFSFDNIVINRPQVNLVVEEGGNRNWEPLKVKNSNYYGPKLKNLISKLTKFKSISVENGSLLYTDIEDEKNKDISNIYATISSADSSVIKLESKGVYKAIDHQLNLQLNLRTNGAAKLSTKLTSKGYDLDLNGMINEMYNFRKINFRGKLAAKIENANDISLYKSVDKIKDKYLDLKNVDLDSEVTISKNSFKAQILKFTAINKDLKGDVSLEKRNNNGYDVNLDLDIMSLDIKKPKVEAKKASKFEWSDNLIDFSFLNNISFNASVKCEKCTYGKKVFRQANLSASLENNNLIVRQLSIKSENGGFLKLSTTAGLNSPVAFEVKAEASDFPLHTLMPNVFNGVSEFDLEGNANFLATGVSPKAMFSNLSGTFKFKTLKTKLNSINSTSLKSLADGVFKNKAKVNYSTHLGDIKFEGALRDGVFRSSDISFILNDNQVVSKGKFDLANLTMGYRVEPANLSRNNLGIVISGNINNLEIIEDKITPKGVVDGFGRVVTTNIVKKSKKADINTPFDFNDKANLDQNVQEYLFKEN